MAPIRIAYNTIYGASNDNNGPSGGTFVGGGIILHSDNSSNWKFPTTIRNNIVQQPTATSTQGTSLYAGLLDVTAINSNVTWGATGSESVMWSLMASCAQS